MKRRSVLASVGRVALPALGAVAVLAAGVWLAAAGAAWLAWALGFGGCLALGHLLNGRWGANRTLAWSAALVFWVTVIVPGVALGRDAVLAERGQRVQATVTGYRHVAGARSSSTYTKVRTQDGRYLEVYGFVDRASHGPVSLLVDPAGTVAPQLVSDVTVGSDLAWSVAGLAVALAAIIGFGISGERDRRGVSG